MEMGVDNWTSIPPDILLLIAGKIVSGDDYVRFSAVCRTWYVIANDLYTNFNHKLNLRPFYVPGADPGSKRITLRNLASGTTLPINLPETAGTSRCWGSPFGWLIAFDHTDLRLTLFNPFTGATIPLPSLPFNQPESSRYIDDRRCKAFLTASPDSDPHDCLVAFSIPSKLAALKPKSKSWSCFSMRLDELDELHKVVYWKGNVYGINSSSHTSVKLFLFELPQPEILNPKGRTGLVQYVTVDLTPDHQKKQNRYNNHYDFQNDFLSGKLPSSLEGCSMFRRMKAHTHLVVVDGELCIHAHYYYNTQEVFTPATTHNRFKIHLFEGNLTRIEPLGNHCLHFGYDYSFSCDTRHRDLKLHWGQKEERYICECLDDYVTYNRLVSTRSGRPFDVEVWNLLSSSKGDDYPASSSRPFWILPSIKFLKLEEAAINHTS